MKLLVSIFFFRTKRVNLQETPTKAANVRFTVSGVYQLKPFFRYNPKILEPWKNEENKTEEKVKERCREKNRGPM